MKEFRVLISITILLYSHIKSLKARVERLKKEKQLGLLEAQFHQYAAAAAKLAGQASELDAVKNALFTKMQFLHDVITPLSATEQSNLQSAINGGNTVTQIAPQLFQSGKEVTKHKTYLV